MKVCSVWFCVAFVGVFGAVVLIQAQEKSHADLPKRYVVQAVDGEECVEVTVAFTRLEWEIYQMFSDFEAMMDAHGQTEFRQFGKLLIRVLEKAFGSRDSCGDVTVAIAPTK